MQKKQLIFNNKVNLLDDVHIIQNVTFNRQTAIRIIYNLT